MATQANRSGLWEAYAVGDPAQTWNFDLFMPAIPGTSDTRLLTWKCQTSTLPGTGFDKVEVPLDGVKLQFAGMRTYSHQFQSMFLEAADWSTRMAFLNWSDTIHSWENNSGSFSSVYKANLQLVVYNPRPQIARVINVFGCWPETVGDVSMDKGNSTAVQLDITWSFDRTTDV